MTTTTYSPDQLRHEGLFAVRQYGKQRKTRAKLMSWSLEISEKDIATLIVRGWAGVSVGRPASCRNLDDAFTIRVAI